MPLTLDQQNVYRARYARKHPDWQPATTVFEQTIRAHWQIGHTLLDLGCGRGGVLEQLTDLEGLRIGVDPDWASLVEHRLPLLSRAVSNADDLPFRGASFQMMIAAWVLEHLPQPERTFAEISRVLKPGGVCIVMTPNRNSPITLLNRTLKPLQQTLVPMLYGRAEADTFPVVYRANTPTQLSLLAQRAGLTVDTCHLIPDPTYLAFNEPLYHLSTWLTDRLPARWAVHLVAVLRK
jgi:SAM-dependent methyltransferase